MKSFSNPPTPTRPTPLTNRRQNGSTQPMNSMAKKQSKESIDTKQYLNYNPEKEPIKAYLRIRPRLDSQKNMNDKPYLQILNKEEVCMIPPENSKAYRTRPGISEKYRFTQVFDGSTSQQTFFTETTLSMVKNVLAGYNALLFAYGVTSSGKTYSIVGGDEGEQPGLLPRALMTIFNSIKGHHSEKKIKPIMHSSLKLYQDEQEENRHVFKDADELGLTRSVDNVNEVLAVDTTYEYGIWVSFVEIYNERIYDLLDSNKLTKRKHLSLRFEQSSGHKYVVNTKVVKLNSSEEANAIVKLGQKNRQVFSTLMNDSSSRSHSIFTVYVVRSLKARKVIDEGSLPKSAIVSKLSIVDLAGSERYRNTNSTGMRLREAGNINKSLMVLGQCMEVLRMNQFKKDLGKNPAIVPYRHSKLTELFKSTFEGDGKAVIIVNVNPFDTGYDENIHVMRFSAVAKDVTLEKPTPHTLTNQLIKNDTNVIHRLQHVLRSLEENDSQDEEIEEGLVDSLIVQLEELWEKWVVAERKLTTLEFTLKEELKKEMKTELQRIEGLYLDSLRRESEKLGSHLDSSKSAKTATRKVSNNESEISDEIHKRQQSIEKDLEYFREKINSYESEKLQLLETIASLEKIAREQRAPAQPTVVADVKFTLNDDIINDDAVTESTDKSGKDEMEIDTIDTEGNNDSASANTFSDFLNLRKQLRRSIFKKEELNEDVDKVMSKVEQFPNVSFDLAKETKMGRLLKMISQEQFEKDPYQIRERALRLFKRYAQLRTVDESPAPSSSESMQGPVPSRLDSPGLMEDTMDIEQLIAENFKLKQKVKLLSKGQKKLKEAFERTRLSVPSLKTLSHGEIAATDVMTATLATKEKEEDKAGNSTIKIKVEPVHYHQAPEQQHRQQNTKRGNKHRVNDSEDFSNDLSEIIKQAGQRTKRRRKLRAF